MPTRHTLFRQFGPKLTEALLLVILTEINTLREEQGMQPLTIQNLIDEASNHITEIEDYDWMPEPE